QHVEVKATQSIRRVVGSRRVSGFFESREKRGEKEERRRSRDEMVTTAAMGSICGPQLPSRPVPVLKVGSSGRSTVRVRAAAAGRRGRRPQNAEGDFFVDERCIDCDACRWLAPETFRRVGGQSAVFRQPNSEEERFRALQITFPLPIDEQSLPGVYHCGYHSEKTYGATSYLIVHPEGNILVDSPKYKEILARRIDVLGGVRYMFLTHKDDVGDHQLWSKRFSCERILHSGDVDLSTADVEMQLYGDGPWSIGTDFELIHTPGHTKAIKMQLDSVRKFLDMDFLWILPGHGRRERFRDVDEKNSALQAFLAAKALKYDSALVA
ncbi:hypothetical protein Taro_030255, partial [Colocasia esculenta]|nr:hypothetical protein [Colocasia esculenta]